MNDELDLGLNTALDVKNTGINNPTKINVNPFTSLTVAKPEADITGGDLLRKAIANTSTTPSLKTETLYNAKPYIQNGFNLTDADIAITPNLEANLSRTQTNLDRLGNRAVKGLTNLASMLLISTASNPLEGLDGTINNLDDGSWQSNVFKKSQEINSKYVNYETANDKSDKFIDQLYNWLPFTDSTKSIGGTLLESGGFILGSMGGTVIQSAIAGALTEGLGVIPAFANGLQKMLNTSKYLEKGLQYSKIAQKAALNLGKVVNAGDITQKTANLLEKVYFMQQGAYGEALFEGLEGKENTIKTLSDEYENKYGFKPTGAALKEIEETGKSVGQTRAYINNALLFATGAGELATVFKTKNALKQSAEELADSMGSKISVEGTQTTVNKTADFAFKTKNEWWNKGFGKTLKTATEKAVNLYSPKTAGQTFLAQGLQEGGEEFAQTTIDKGVTSYYDAKYHHNDESVVESIKTGLKQSMSKEGFEAFFSGAISGGTIALLGHLYRNSLPKTKEAKIEFEKNQSKLSATYNELENRLRKLSPRDRKIVEATFKTESVQGDLLDRIGRTNVSKKLLDISDRSFDDVELDQVQNMGLYNLAMPYVKHGNIDIVKEQFKGFLEYSDEEFQNVFGEVKGKTKNEIIEGHINEFEKINKAYSKVNNAFSTNLKYQKVNDTDTTDVANKKLENNKQYKIHQELVQDLSFDYYNIDNLKSSSKSIETDLGDLVFLKDYVNEKGIKKVKKDNDGKIKDLSIQIETLTLDDVESKLLKKQLVKQKEKLEKANEYLEKGEFEYEGFNQNLRDNVVNPYLQSIKNDDIDNIELNEKLNKVTQLENINAQIKKIQNKLDMILGMENPSDYYKSKLLALLKNIAKNENIVPEKKEEIINDEEYKEILNGKPITPEKLEAIVKKKEQNLPLTDIESEILFTRANVINKNNKEKSESNPTSDVANSKIEIKVGDFIKWDVFGNEESEDWQIKEFTKTRGGKEAVVLTKQYVEDVKTGKTYSKQFAEANNISYQNEFTVEHIVPTEDINLESQQQELSQLETIDEEPFIPPVNSGDNIISKLDETIYVFDKDGNEIPLEDALDIIEHRNRLINDVLNGKTTFNYTFKIITNKIDKLIEMRDEKEMLYKLSPKNLLLVFHEGMNVASVNLDENTLFVPVEKLKLSESTKKKLKVRILPFNNINVDFYAYDELINNVTESEFEYLLTTGLLVPNANLQQLKKSLLEIQNTKTILKNTPEKFELLSDIKVFNNTKIDSGKIKLEDCHFYDAKTPRINISPDGEIITILNIDDLEDINEKEIIKEIYEINKDKIFSGNFVMFLQKDVDGNQHYYLEQYTQGDYYETNKSEPLTDEVGKEFYVQLTKPNLDEIKTNIKTQALSSKEDSNLRKLDAFLETNDFIPKLSFITNKNGTVNIKLFSTNNPDLSISAGVFDIKEGITNYAVYDAIKEALTKSVIIPNENYKIIKNKGTKAQTAADMSDVIISSHNRNIPNQYFTTAYFKILPTAIENELQTPEIIEEEAVIVSEEDKFYDDLIKEVEALGNVSDDIITKAMEERKLIAEIMNENVVVKEEQSIPVENIQENVKTETLETDEIVNKLNKLSFFQNKKVDFKESFKIKKLEVLRKSDFLNKLFDNLEESNIVLEKYLDSNKDNINKFFDIVDNSVTATEIESKQKQIEILKNNCQ